MRCASWTVVIGLGLPGAGIVLGGAAWPFELAHHFIGHLAAVALGAVAVGLMLGQRPPALAAAALAAGYGAVALAPASGGLIAAQARTADSAPLERIEVVSFNLLADQDAPAETLAWLAGAPADVLVLVEASPRWRHRFESLREAYPHQVMASPRADAIEWVPHAHDLEWIGVAVLSRLPVREARVLYPAGPVRPAVVATVETAGGPVTLAAAHPQSPVTRRGLAARDRYMDSLAAALAGVHGPLIVAGDLNATRFTPMFRRFSYTLGLEPARRPPATFPALAGPFGIGIDHVLVRGARLERVEPLPPRGSDHRGLRARLALPGR